GYVITPVAEDVIGSALAKDKDIDYMKASNWFPKSPARTSTAGGYYTISIPKLRIINAKVRIGTDDLTKNIIHYGGTGLPGKAGNAVLFGHSILPQFYDPNNYLSIFSLLPKLKEGDDIFVRYDGVDYRYEVTVARVAAPDDVAGLEQRYDDSYVTLVTCVPPGTYLERLWVTAKQSPFGSENDNPRS
ncbi:MAG: class E sortase, partial [Patescibacteria group bacterium]